MPTTNINITNAWTKVADTANADVLITWETPVYLEVATTSADAAPAVTGHKVHRDSAITRDVLGPGYIWAKIVDTAVTGLNLVVSK